MQAFDPSREERKTMSLRKLLFCAPALLLGALLAVSHASAGEKTTPPDKAAKASEKPRVEVVFCLDTTGSMSGLIDAAKKKIWSISNQITTGKPTPQVKIGIVNYRDRGDSFVTKVFDLTDDLDSIYTTLMSFNADEGGDTPESVNQALFDAVHKIAWSKDKKVLKMIFLVGDAPPHMDYPDDVKYPETCKEAVKRDIIINTVLCGNSGTAKEHWLKICRSAEGSFVQIDAGGGPIVAIATPFDKDLEAINSKISATTLCFGDAGKKASDGALAGTGGGLKGEAAAGRLEFYAREGRVAAYDFLQQIKDGKVKLKEIKDAELPKELQGKTEKEQKEILTKLDEERQELNAKAVELSKKR